MRAPQASQTSIFGQAAGGGVANPAAAGSNAAAPGGGTSFPRWEFPAMPAAYYNKDQRFKRIAEGVDGLVGQGTFGDVFQGYDELKQETVFIKRQSTDTAQAAKEMACYNMLEAYSHPNIIRLCGMWTGTFKTRSYLYIAMEACSTTLWDFIRVDNPCSHLQFRRCGGPHLMLLDIVRAVGWLHSLGVIHGDLSLSNILLTSEGTVKLGDFGTVTSQQYLTAELLCAAYVRAPEVFLGSLARGPPVDAWAAGIIALALMTGKVPTSSHMLPREERNDDYVLIKVTQLLPSITDTLWPEHRKLPRWLKYEHRLQAIHPTGTLAQFVEEHQIHPLETCMPAQTVSLVELGMLWNPHARSSMLQMENFLTEHFQFPVLQGCQPMRGHREQGPIPPKGPAMPIDAPVVAAPQFPCCCSGNCGLQPCTSKLNYRRHHAVPDICENFADFEHGFCRMCKCESEMCTKQRQKLTRRWCTKCAQSHGNSDYATAHGSRDFEPDENLLWKVVLRFNFLHPHLDPDDNVAFQEVCKAFNEPKAGSPMDPVGVVILVLAHALKWPPVVRHYLETLRHRSLPLSPGRGSAVMLVDAVYEAIEWADGKRLEGMHAVLSVAGRAHAQTGVAVSSGQLGIISTVAPDGVDHREISLGVVGKTYFLKTRAALASTEALVEQYIQLATRAELHWPDPRTPFQEFAKAVSMLMISCHSVKIDGVGLKGGKSAQKDLNARSATPKTGCQPTTRLLKKTEPPPYIVPHITRHFILAADKLGLFDYKSLNYRDIAEYVPDVTSQADKVANFTLAAIKDNFGLDPFHLSCHLCFAHQFKHEDLLPVLQLSYANLYEPIGKSIASKLGAVPTSDVVPLNLHALLQALMTKTTSTRKAPDMAKEPLAIMDGHSGPTEDIASDVCNRSRKVRKSAKK